MLLSSFIRKQRSLKKLTQKDLARKLDVTINSVQAWERDAGASVPNPYQLRALSEEFGVSADKLLQMLPPERVAERS